MRFRGPSSLESPVHPHAVVVSHCLPLCPRRSVVVLAGVFHIVEKYRQSIYRQISAIALSKGIFAYIEHPWVLHHPNRPTKVVQLLLDLQVHHCAGGNLRKKPAHPLSLPEQQI